MKEEQRFSILRHASGQAIIAFAIILSTIIAGSIFYSVKNAESSYLSVTGSAKQKVMSDQVRWNSQFSRRIYLSQIKSGYAQMDKDLKLVKEFFSKNGISEKDMTISPVYMEEIYDYNNNQSSTDKQYTLRQTIQINSPAVEKIGELSKQVGSLINQGVVFSTFNLEYYYSKLPELRVSMLSNAIKDAKARAEMIAKSGGNKIGAMKSASSGVVQVLAPNSIDISDYGNYDTSSLEKEVMVTVRASFNIK